MKAIDIEERLILFASKILKLIDQLPVNPSSKHIGSQLIRSSTSPALNYAEAQGAESKADFIHKMKICLKELRETHVCLKLIDKQNWIHSNQTLGLLKEGDELISIFVASLKTATGNSNKHG